MDLWNELVPGAYIYNKIQVRLTKPVIIINKDKDYREKLFHKEKDSVGDPHI